MYYVTTKDETTIIYTTKEHITGETEHFFTFKGRFPLKPTEYNIQQFLHENNKIKEEDKHV